MYNITKEEIEKMQILGSGTFGNIYLNNDMVFKVYHDNINAYNTFFGHKDIIPNPCLKSSIFKYEYLKKKNLKLQYNDLIYDILYINGTFSGVVLPYYKGKTLEECKKNSIEKKVNISQQIVMKAQELTDNHIYPLDYKSNNILVENSNVHIIDLDDKLTKIINPIYKSRSIKILDSTIKKFIGDIDYNKDIKNINIQNLLIKEEKTNSTYNKIIKYLQNLLKKNNYLLLNDNSDIEKHLEILRNPNYRIIYIYDSINNIDKEIINLIKLNIHVYTIIPKKKFKEFLLSIAYDKMLMINKKNVIRIK